MKKEDADVTYVGKRRLCGTEVRYCKTDGDGVIERHVKNLLYSRILEESEDTLW